LAQTPQVFRYDLILKAHERARQEGYSATDDASLVEELGENVKIITGSRINIKITIKEDLDLARCLLEMDGLK
jgi:2-C-methyl-D-erythritol 4-phosphate cytidylyltransferase